MYAERIEPMAHSEQQLLYVPQVVDIQNDLRKNKINLIISGVGSGKSTLANVIANQYCTLLATSRRGTVNQTLYKTLDEEKKIQLYVDNIWATGNIHDKTLYLAEKCDAVRFVPKEYREHRRIVSGVGPVYNQSTCITYAKVNYFISSLRDKYREKKYYIDNYKVLWDLYDIFIFDEVHSIVTDCNYQESMFSTWDLIETFDRQFCESDGKTMVLMTGTPEPIMNSLSRLSHVNIINCMDTCMCVKPEYIEFITHSDAIKEMEFNLKYTKKKMFYFKSGAAITVKDFCRNKDMDSELVCTTFSDKEKRNKLEKEDEEAFKTMLQAEEDIERYQRFPQKKQLIVSSSRYAEGQEIKEYVDILYVSSHAGANVIQMAGRLRLGGYVLKIITDASEFMGPDYFTKLEALMKKEKNDLEQINKSFNEHPEDKKCEFINYITETYQFIRFNYFKGAFQFAEIRKENLKYYKEAFMKWHKRNSQLVAMGDIQPNYYQRIVQKWFPNVPIAEFKSRKFFARERIRKALKHGKVLSKECYQKLLDDLCQLYESNHRINWFLKDVGIRSKEFVRVNGKGDEYEYKDIKEKNVPKL